MVFQDLIFPAKMANVDGNGQSPKHFRQISMAKSRILKFSRDFLNPSLLYDEDFCARLSVPSSISSWGDIRSIVLYPLGQSEFQIYISFASTSCSPSTPAYQTPHPSLQIFLLTFALMLVAEGRALRTGGSLHFSSFIDLTHILEVVRLDHLCVLSLSRYVIRVQLIDRTGPKHLISALQNFSPVIFEWSTRYKV
jgi:hypothetical protein